MSIVHVTGDVRQAENGRRSARSTVISQRMIDSMSRAARVRALLVLIERSALVVSNLLRFRIMNIVVVDNGGRDTALACGNKDVNGNKDVRNRYQIAFGHCCWGGGEHGDAALFFSWPWPKK